jgi:hypothetical protein
LFIHGNTLIRINKVQQGKFIQPLTKPNKSSSYIVGTKLLLMKL